MYVEYRIYRIKGVLVGCGWHMHDIDPYSAIGKFAPKNLFRFVCSVAFELILLSLAILAIYESTNMAKAFECITPWRIHWFVKSIGQDKRKMCAIFLASVFHFWQFLFTISICCCCFFFHFYSMVHGLRNFVCFIFYIRGQHETFNICKCVRIVKCGIVVKYVV